MTKRLPKGWWGALLFGGLLVAVWYGIREGFGLAPYQLPTPDEVFRALLKERTTLARATLTTLQGAGVGFLAAVALGFGLSLVLASSARLRTAVFPYIILMQMIPIIASAAIIVMWLDVGLQTVAVIAFLLGFFPIVANTLHGLTSVPPPMVELFRLYEANKWQELWHLRVPHALPSFFTGVQIAATLAVIGSVTGEIFAGSSRGAGGLGFMIIIYKSSLKMPEIFAATLLACALGFLFVGAVVGARWWALHRWEERA